MQQPRFFYTPSTAALPQVQHNLYLLVSSLQKSSKRFRDRCGQFHFSAWLWTLPCAQLHNSPLHLQGFHSKVPVSGLHSFHLIGVVPHSVFPGHRWHPQLFFRVPVCWSAPKQSTQAFVPFCFPYLPQTFLRLFSFHFFLLLLPTAWEAFYLCCCLLL